MAVSDLTKLWEGNRENFGATSSSADETYRCAWSDRITSKTQLIGRIHSDHSWMVCTDVDMEPLGDVDSSVGGPGNAQLTVHYMDQSSAEESGKFIEETGKSDAFHATDGWRERWTAAGEAITVGTGFRWSDLTPSDKIRATDDISAVKMFPTANVTVSGHTARVNSNAKNLMLNAVGKLNKKTIKIRGYAYSDHHLLFLVPELDEGKNAAGSRVDGVTLGFAYRHDASWNEFWRPSTQTFAKLIGIASNLPPYSDVSFSDLNPKNW